MAKYKSGPRWINVKFDGSCVCKSTGSVAARELSIIPRIARSIASGRIAAASGDFGACAFDEDRGGSM